ncbi:hypothetical protein Agub_g15459 [Astrephomene gubernaculifera]|uniref:Guanine nucleotide-binding protein subunit beta-like protein n=1 Tax=Astrephomene gubernaculifera TaxID=47775 RepID=A0AAD3HTR4_9CHLO|nr:hypothetical protein Agub_g15459 [Astrephomene gubernaculifera]
MKITIEVEIQPDEVGLAAELLSTLRTLTDHVKVVTPAAGAVGAATAPAIANGPAAPHVPPARAAPTPPATQPQQPATSLPQQPQQPQLPAAPAMPPAAPAAPAPAPAPAAQHPTPAPPPQQPPQPQPPQPQPPQQPPQQAPAAAAAAAPQGPQGTPQPLHACVPRLASPATQEQAVADVVATLRAAEREERLPQAVEELVASFEQQVFDNPEVIGSTVGVLPYMSLYQRLPEELRPKVRDRMVAKVLTALTRKRPPSADRTSFFAYADAFATLVKFEAVPMDGAVQTLARLLLKPDNRVAGVTMLGKTVEYCGEQLLRTPETHLANLWRALEAVKEEAFSYDLQYILQTLHALLPPGSQLPGAAPAPPASTPAAAAPAAPAPTSAPATSPPPAPAAAPAAAAAPATSSAPAAPAPNPTPTSMVHMGCYSGHVSTVFTMCYDATSGQLASGGQDGQLLVWGHDGTPASRLDVSSHFICSLDVLPRSGTILAAGVPIDHSNPEGPPPAEPPCVLAFSPPPAAGGPATRMGPWTPRGRLYGPGRGLISFVRSLGGDGEVFAIGENVAATTPGTAAKDVVSLYDASRGGPMEQSVPLVSYGEHRDMVTCAAPWWSNPAVFVSGGRDCAIKVWDRRMAQSVGGFGELDSGSGVVRAHGDMVTCLDTTDNLLLSTSVDSYMCIWDFRQLSLTHGSVAGPMVKLQLDTQPTLKIAVTGAPHSRLAAISTYQGLYVMDFTHLATPHTLIAPPFSDGRPFKYYHDIRWAGGPGAPGQPVLFGASDDPRIDVFGLAF